MAFKDSLIAVKYVGRKPVKYDTVCHTPTSWTPGATRAVSPEVAARLFGYPTIWIEGNMEDIDLPKAAPVQASVAPLQAEPVQPEAPEPEPEPEPEAAQEPEQPEEFDPAWLCARPFLAFKNGLVKLTDDEIDQVNQLERNTKNRPGFLKAIQDDLERRATAAA